MKTLFGLLWRAAVAAAAIVSLVACGGGGSGNTNMPDKPATSVTVDTQPLTVKPLSESEVIQTGTGIQVVKSQLIVVTAADLSRDQAISLFGKAGAVIVGEVPEAQIYQIEIKTAGDEASLVKVRDALSREVGISSVSFNSLSGVSVASGSPWLPTGGRYNDQSWAIKQIDGEAAWRNVYQATQSRPLSRVRVGIIDSGFSAEHPDISFTQIYGPRGETDSVSGESPAIPANLNNQEFREAWSQRHHGMHVAGIIGAKGGNLDGTAGVAWQAPREIYVARTDFSDMSTLVHVARLVKQGVKVINLSLGPKVFNQERQEAWASSYGNLIQRLAPRYDFLLVFSAGNENGASAVDLAMVGYLFNPSWGKYAEFSVARGHVLIVGASYNRPFVTGLTELPGDYFAPYSNRGPQAIEIVAPGGGAGCLVANDPLITFSQDSPFLCPASPGVVSLGMSGTTLMKGTSMAAPHVTGAAALAWSINPSLSARQIKDMLVGSPNTIKDDAGNRYQLLSLSDLVQKVQQTSGAGSSSQPTVSTTVIVQVGCTLFQGGKALPNVPITIEPSSQPFNSIGGPQTETDSGGFFIAELSHAVMQGYGTDRFNVRLGATSANPAVLREFTLASAASGYLRRITINLKSSTSDCSSALDTQVEVDVSSVGSEIRTDPIASEGLRSALQAGIYDLDGDSACYHKSTLGPMLLTAEYQLTESNWCLNAGKSAWVLTSEDPGEIQLPSGAWTSYGGPTFAFTSGTTFSEKYGGTSFADWSVGVSGSVGAGFPSDAKTITLTGTTTRSKYRIFGFNAGSGGYNMGSDLNDMIARWNTSNNGVDYLIVHGNTNGFAFVTPPVSNYTAGAYFLYDVSKPSVCTTTGTGKNAVTTCARPRVGNYHPWVYKLLPDGSKVIQLDPPKGLGMTDRDFTGRDGHKAIFVKRPTDPGVRGGHYIEAGTSTSFTGYNRAYMDAKLQALGLPKTSN